MSSFSGLSAMLTVSLVALVTINVLKDKFNMIENYGEDNNNESFTYQPDSAMPFPEQKVNIPSFNTNLSNEPKHNLNDFGQGDFFRQPIMNSDPNGWNNTPDSYKMHVAQIVASTPNMDNLKNIGAVTESLPGPNLFNNDSYASYNGNSERANNLSLCAQNYSTGGVGLNSIASSLLPSPDNMTTEGFNDCNLTNPLSNQVFLSPPGAFGLDTTSSLRNSNQSLRSEPPNPVQAVGPWNLSTIYPDLLRRPLEGCGPSFGMYGNGANGSGVPSKIMS